MLYVLYNSLSKTGRNQSKIFNIVSKIVKIMNEDSLKIINVASSNNNNSLLDRLTNEDKIIIIGGDGTLTHIINTLKQSCAKPEIYAYKAGTGNDFVRNVKIHHKPEKRSRHLYKINEFIEKLPIIKSGNTYRYFLNGTGFGIDALIAKTVNEKKKSGARGSFFRTTIECLKKYKRLNNIKITVDKKEYFFNNINLVSVMNGPYYGGGMKIAPNADILSDKLCVIVVHDLAITKLLGAFMLVYSGMHTAIKNVEQIFGNEIKIENITNDFSQIDGEIFETGSIIEFKK
ncbi:diacylglycerol/lipid kinase family protein [Mycoplasma sp. 332]|uniref:diacylglycerol/lipid kinase family protein n=1 Tax=Mycoplasma sp. 332 TaxID=3458236 RepID=UPI0040355CFF